MKTKLIYTAVAAIIILCSSGAVFAEETAADTVSDAVQTEITDTDIADEADDNAADEQPSQVIAPPAAPKGLKARVKTISNNIRLSWKKVKDCDGYRVYRYSKSSGRYILKKTIRGSRTYYTDRKLKSSGTYRYKVCAYKLQGNNKIEGEFSKTVKKKTYKTYKGIALAKPLKKLSTVSSYGWRWGRMHHGNDYRASHGTAIYAAADGKVIESHGSINSMGTMVKISHGKGITTTYGHMSSRCVKKGQQVKAGDKIGRAGATGNALCAHLHFEVRINGKAYNPKKFY